MTTTAKSENVDAVSPLAATVVDEVKTVELPLAAFISANRAARLGITTKSTLNPGDKVKVTIPVARQMISEGAIAVDPADNDAVAKLLKV